MTKKVLAATAVLIVIVVVFAYLNAAESEDRLQSQREAEIYLKSDGEDIATVEFEDILELDEHEFEETLRSSDSPDRDNMYTGILMKDLIEEYDISLSDSEQVVTRAADGYTVALTPDEVLDEENVYIVYKVNGEPLSPKEEGGSGPYQVIIRQDEFGQRWNKFLMEIDVN
ncbi:molybdopterin-dependent oxidoreductase [Natranaerobius thermophilus]|uniref:Oxidoreductase molybdopterin-binding domain-containing protein n=1 Tax=Natranaerobius thermophilus (strain ATCC BAA-1301 / DSM 18059 / JW/NM-WN-LF) TaxID=457570 RepID=B2A597_NATTJ|nr:molybdopterin-dependent oxidoreductase [Natranaerobius thermophilus]ACB83931.1 hypothetical protein Nther_0334 [Natranaerobius thermophilus JW/NM-WN-LF]